MKRSSILWWLLLSGVVACLSTSGQDKNPSALIKNAPPILGDSYKCEQMVRAVNGLRRLGKAGALAALRNYIEENDPHAASEEHRKLLLICRLLFVNPQGWKSPRLGHPSPDVEWSVADQMPLFPIVISDGVPFLLIRGFMAGGFTSDTADKCVKLCESFPLINADMAEQSFELAAQRLVRSELFQRLYPNHGDRSEAEEMILRQARSNPNEGEQSPPKKSNIEVKIEQSAP